MSVSPSKDLSRHFGHAAILSTAGISVKDCQTPKTVKCPFCEKDTMGVYTDPQMVSSQWLICRGCGAKGDTIEIFARMKGIDTLEDAISRAICDGLNIGEVDRSSDSLNTYKINFPERRQKYQNIWSSMQDLLVDNPHPDIVHRLQHEHIWGGSRPSSRRFLKFIGGGLKRDLDALFAKPVVPKSFKTAIVLNFQDKPGKTCAFQFHSDAGEVFTNYITEATNNDKHEGGLAMLDNINPIEGTVFAVNDVEFGLQLQRLWLNTTSIPAKLVIYNDNTNAAWQSFNAERVIMWEKEISWRTFDHARRVKSAWIASRPSPYVRMQSVYAYITDTGAPQVFDTMVKSAVEWPTAFCNWVLDPETPESVAREAANQLAFNTFDKNLILEKCPPGRRSYIESLTSGLRVMQRATFNRQHVEEWNNGWNVVYSAGVHELICDAMIKVHEERCEKKSGKISWKGIIKFNGKEIGFEDNLEVIEKDIEGWLRKKTVAAGLGTPTIRPNWRRYIVNIAKTFSNAKAVESEVKLGMQGSGDFIMPRFKLSGGAVMMEAFPIYSESTPGMDVMAPAETKPVRSKTVTPARAASAVLASIFVMNQVRRMRGMTPRPTAIIGTAGSVARSATKNFAESFGMRSFVLQQPSEATGVLEKIRQFDFPAYIEPFETGKLIVFPPTNSDDVFVVCSDIEAYALAVGGGWTILNAPNTREDVCSLPPVDDVLNYICDLQNRNFALDAGPFSMAHDILKDFCSWYARYAGLDFDQLYIQANHMFYTPSAGEALIDLFASMVINRKVGMMHRRFTASLFSSEETQIAVSMDDTEMKVLLSKHALGVALRVHKLPKPDFAMPTTDLAQKELLRPCENPAKGWLIEKEFWDNQCRKLMDRNRSSGA